MRLVDADALKENCYIKVGDTTVGYRQYVMFHEIDNAPTIDAVSVVRSEWIMDMGEVWICRNCGNGYKDQPTCMGKPMFEYCPFCGAKMDGEAKE